MPIRNVNIVHAVINEHAPIFYELIELIIDSLRSKGVQVSRTTNQVYPDQLNIIVGHTMFLSPNSFTEIRNVTHDYIVFQLEALNSEQGFSSSHPAYYEFLRGAKQVWEYSPQNTRYLAQLGVTNVRYIPVGYSPRLDRIIDPVEHDIDILFFGAITPRRQQILGELRRCGFKTALLFGVYGSVRDACIARAKIQLNIHQSETLQLEQLRVAYLLNNKRFVVSETSADNPYGNGVVFCDYKDIVTRCAYYLKPGMEVERMWIAKSDHECLKHIPMASSIFNALAELAPD